MDEEELLDCMSTLSEYCAGYEGSCEGCVFYQEVSFLDKKKGFCHLTNNVPEDW